MRKRVATFFLVLIWIVLLTVAALAGEVNLSIAASLKEVINDLSASFTKQNPDVNFLKNYGASGTLAKQIENGAPGDIFISANLEWLDYLKSKKLIDADRSGTFAFNTLVFAGSTEK